MRLRGADWVSYIYPVVPLAITPWNPPPGLSLALLLRGGLSSAPWLFVAALLAELLVRGADVSLPVLLVACGLTALAYSALAAALRGPLSFKADFTTLRDASVFVIGVGVTSGLLAIAFVSVFYLAGYIDATDYTGSILQFWIGDLIGIVVMTPLLLVLTRRGPRTRLIEWVSVAQLGTVLLALWVIFASGWMEGLKLFYVLFLPLIWIAMRWGVEGTVVATTVIQVGLIAAVRVGGYGAGTVLEFQFLMLAVAVTGLFLGLTVSERRAIEQQLRDKQFELDRSLRLAGASEMASALAHELNQPLTAINTYVRACELLIREGNGSPERLRETIDKVVSETTRAGNVVRQLRDFFRTGSGQLASLSVTSLLQSAIDAARTRAQRHHVHWRLECGESLPAVVVDRIQVETVLHNLISNAIDALKEMPDHARHVVVSAKVQGPHSVCISVTDSGPGIASEVAALLFRPFATTKPRGMGLGLAMSRSIVEAHGGRLWLEPASEGSTFSFTLPTDSTTS